MKYLSLFDICNHVFTTIPCPEKFNYLKENCNFNCNFNDFMFLTFQSTVIKSFQN